MSYTNFVASFFENGAGNPAQRQGIPLNDILSNLKAQRDEALQASTRSSEQDSLIQRLSRVDQVPGISSLPDDKLVTHQEFDELWFLLDLLKDEVAQRVLGEDTYPGTLLGKLQAAAASTHVSSIENMVNVVLKAERETPGAGRAVGLGILQVLKELMKDGEPDVPKRFQGLADREIMDAMPAAAA